MFFNHLKYFCYFTRVFHWCQFLWLFFFSFHGDIILVSIFKKVWCHVNCTNSVCYCLLCVHIYRSWWIWVNFDQDDPEFVLLKHTRLIFLTSDIQHFIDYYCKVVFRDYRWHSIKNPNELGLFYESVCRDLNIHELRKLSNRYAGF